MTATSKPTPRERFTASERLHYRFLGDQLRELEWDIRHPQMMRLRVPPEWHEICTNPTKHRRAVTLRLNEDVVKFFKGLGPGYQEKMNRVLAAFMHARLSRMVEGPESIDYILEGLRQDEARTPRPRPGDMEAQETAWAEQAEERARQREAEFGESDGAGGADAG